MPAIMQPEILRRAVADPYAVAYEAMALVARKDKSKGSKGGKKKGGIKGGAVAGIIIAIILAIIIICVVLWFIKRKQKKKNIGGH